MSALALEERMAVEDRISKLESDVGHLRSDVAEVKLNLKSLKTEVSSLKTEVAMEFGSIRVQLERNKLWMLATGATTILSVLGSAATVVRLLRP